MLKKLYCVKCSLLYRFINKYYPCFLSVNIINVHLFHISYYFFLGDNVDCWMEIQHGKGPWAPPVNGIVPLGSTLTLVVAINDFRGNFILRFASRKSLLIRLCRCILVFHI